MQDFDPNKKVYKAKGGNFSILDLLRNFADPELEVDGISRISDLHLKVKEPVRYRYDGDLETIEGGEPLTEETLRELIFPLISQSQRQRLIDNPHLDIDAGYSWE
ncbi:MAG: twitching motility protein, partial [Verrucomicrobiota bacterium]|nr:twitching motility protein [Verrucomicrobiota bacterium]